MIGWLFSRETKTQLAQNAGWSRTTEGGASNDFSALFVKKGPLHLGTDGVWRRTKNGGFTRSFPMN